MCATSAAARLSAGVSADSRHCVIWLWLCCLYQVVGLDAVVATLRSLVATARADAALPESTRIVSLVRRRTAAIPVGWTNTTANDGPGMNRPCGAQGLCMAGFAEAGPQRELLDALPKADPNLAGSYKVVNDSVGSVYTASDKGTRRASPR